VEPTRSAQPAGDDSDDEVPVAFKPVTLRDVARAAGVSPATASRSLHESARAVTPEMRKRVTDAAKRLGYSPNASAQSMARGGSRTISLIVSDLEDPYFSSIATGVIEAAGADGMRVTLDITRRDPAREAVVIGLAGTQRSRALIFVGSRRANRRSTAALAAQLAGFEKTGGRVVLVSQRGLPYDTIVPDNRSGAAALGRALADMGYERCAVIAQAPELVASSERVNGFVGGLADAGIELPASRILRGEDGWEGGYRLAAGLVDAGLGDLQLIFAISDGMALGAISALRERGIAVPEQVAVAGYGGTIAPDRSVPQITTVQFALRETGAQAYALAVRPRAKGERAVVTQPATVVIRASTPDRTAGPMTG
jgi:LacI family transcriptional regulator